MKRLIFARTAIAIGLTAIGAFFWWQYFSDAPPRVSIGLACIIAGTALVEYGLADDFLTKDA
jgi:hypothetical protein